MEHLDIELPRPALSVRQVCLAGDADRTRLIEAALADSLQLQRAAVVLLDARSRLVFANRRAGRILDAKDGLFATSQGRIWAATVPTTRRLAEAIDTARRPRPDDREGASAFLQVERPSGKRPFVLMTSAWILPEPGRGSQVGVLVFIQDPEEIRQSPTPALMQVFGATDAEAQTGELLMLGKHAQQIAVIRGVAVSTVRTHIRALLAKTGTTSQVAFVALVYRTLGTLI